jgi:acetyl-CoA carboxylase biotin carboxyl carrier protein
MNLTNEDVQEILRILDASSFDELQLSTERFKLTLRRSAAGGWTQETRTLAAPGTPVTAVSSTAEDSAAARAVKTVTTNSSISPSTSSLLPAAAASGETPGATVAGLIDVNPPLIGTFYRAPNPGAAPFVEIGSRVGKHTVIGIIETMKLMNSVYAGAQGEIVEILAANGQLVEQGHVLMRLRPHP